MKLKSAFILLVLCMALGANTAGAQTGRDLSTGLQALAGTQWRLASLGRVGAELNVAAGATVTLKFSAEGRVSGSGGCNNYGGGYRVTGDRLTFTQVFSTKRACVDANANRQETQYFSALESSSRFRLSANRLSIYYDNGRGMLEFVNDEPEPSGDPSSDDVNDPITSLNSYYRAINGKDYERAYRYWENPVQSFDEFRRGFSDTASVRLLVDPTVQVEGAAGSSYAEVAVVLITRRRFGPERSFAGCYVMRKSNVRSETSRRDSNWRISRANLVQVSARSTLSEILTQGCRR